MNDGQISNNKHSDGSKTENNGQNNLSEPELQDTTENTNSEKQKMQKEIELLLEKLNQNYEKRINHEEISYKAKLLAAKREKEERLRQLKQMEDK